MERLENQLLIALVRDVTQQLLTDRVTGMDYDIGQLLGIIAFAASRETDHHIEILH